MGVMAEGAGQFHLRRVLSVSATGVPVLDGTNARLVVTGRFGEGDVGRLAVCQSAAEDEGPMVVVLGVVADVEAEEGPLRLGRGEAMLELHADGRVRLRGSDVAVDATGALRMVAARIDLN
jgi:hypothetical protein